jgi:hypothetical protein
VQRWVDVSDSRHGVTLAPLDAPLTQLGGITTARWTPDFEPEGPTVMSWALNNHWMVNFKASQGGEIALRYRLTTHAGGCDDAASHRFGAEAATPMLVLRDYVRTGATSGSLVSIAGGAGVLRHAKPADDGDGVIVRLQEAQGIDMTVTLRSEARPVSACLTSPIEVNGDSLHLDGNRVEVPVGARAVQSVRLRY